MIKNKYVNPPKKKRKGWVFGRNLIAGVLFVDTEHVTTRSSIICVTWFLWMTSFPECM